MLNISAMTSHPESRIVEIAEWSDHAVQLKDFVGRYPVPNIVKVTKGQYRNIGFAKSVHSHLYLYSVSTGRKILAESVKIKEGKKATVSDQKYAIPLSYQGWFEVLSEDGKAVKAIENVKELWTTYHFTKNSKYLVRENIKAYVQTDNAELSVEKNRLVYLGEVVSVNGEIWLPQQTTKGLVNRKVLSCEDSNGECFYLDFEQKGLFSPVAGQQNISGVHNIHAILQKFRLPITVRLVYGIIPTKFEKHCTGVFRLLHIYSDETAFMCPLKKDSKMVPVSTREPIKIVPAQNFENIKALEEFQYVNERCANMYNSFMNSIHILFSIPEPEAIPPMRHRSDVKNDETNIDPEEENILFEEVEDIYQYVRDGGPVPPAPRPRPMKTKPPPLPEKTSNAKAKLSYLGRSLVNRLSTKDTAKQAVLANAEPGNDNNGHTSVSVNPVFQEPIDPPRDFPDGNVKKEKTKSAKGEWDWEEPIYEPLDKIRHQKKNKGKKQEIHLEMSPKFVADPFENFQVDSEKVQTTPTPNKLSKPIPINSSNDGSAVQNLRQIYKQHSTPETSQVKSNSQNSLEKNIDIEDIVNPIADVQKSEQDLKIPEPDYEDNTFVRRNAPPVPPKHFEKGEVGSRHSHSSGSNEGIDQHEFIRSKSYHGTTAVPENMKRSISTTTVTVTTNTSPVFEGYVHRTTHKHLPRGVPTTVHIEGPTTSIEYPHMMPRISLVPQPHMSAHPPYVAIARVGDAPDDIYGKDAVRHLHRGGSSEHSRRKLQTMYL